MGQILQGSWDLNGMIKFLVYFLQPNTPLNSDIEPTNERAIFRVEGRINLSGQRSRPTFSSTFRKITEYDMMQEKQFSSMPLDQLEHLDYPLVRTMPTPLRHNNSKTMQLFHGSTSTPKINVLSYI